MTRVTTPAGFVLSCTMAMALVVVLASGCDEAPKPVKGRPASTWPSMSFRSNPEAVGPVAEIRSMGIRLSPPRGWDAPPPATRPTSTDTRWASVAGANLDVGFVQSDLSTSAALDRYESGLRSLAAPGRVKSDAYQKDGIEIRQYLSQEANDVVFRLVFQNDKREWIELSYRVPKPAYTQSVATAIECSISSLARL